ncbi:MAG: tetratricopeptide repeat protein [Bacteroidia bacterium]|nr:tetratricopeptide repeat protein [Bacteroidia bacterium]
MLIFFSCKNSKNTSSNTNSSNQVSSNSSVPKGKKLTEEDQIKFKTCFINACRQKALGNIELAEEQFKESLKIDPTAPSAQYELGCIYRFNGLYDDALKYAKGAATTEPKNEWYMLLYIECLHNKKMYNEAASAYEKLIQQFPNKSDYYRELAKEYVYAENYQKAIKTYDNMGQKFGKTAEVYLAKIKLLRQLKKNADAENELKKLIEEYPTESNYYTYLAELYQESGQKEKAMAVYEKLLKIDPKNPYVHLALADYYRSQTNDSAFLREVKIAFKNPDLEVDQKVKILISFYTLSDQYPEYKKDALELCEILVAVHPDEAKAHTTYGSFLEREKKLKEARDQFAEALKTDKSNFAVWTSVMKIDGLLRDNTALEIHSKEAADLFPSQPLPLYYGGFAKIQLKKQKEAIDLLLEAKEYVIENNALLTQIFTSLGDAYNYLKEYEKSDKAFEDALKLDPDNTYILNNYSYYLSLRKAKLDRAEKFSSHANELDKKNPQYMDTYAWILYQQNKLPEAREWIEKALKTGADRNGVVLEHYGDILFKMNEPEKALEYWKKAKDTGRGSENIDKKIAEKKLYE